MSEKVTIHDFIDKVDDVVRKVNHNYSFSDHMHYADDCSHCGLLEGYIYIFIPDDNLQKKVKKRILDYTKKEGLNFIITEQEFCDDRECHGHYTDPFEKGTNHKNVYVNKFPKDINGAYLHILKKDSVKQLQGLANSLKKASVSYNTA
jgi:hypothetical protein